MFDPYSLPSDVAVRLAKDNTTPLSIRTALLMHPSPIVSGVAADQLNAMVPPVDLSRPSQLDQVAYLTFGDWRFDHLLLCHASDDELVTDAARNSLARNAHGLLCASVFTRVLALLMLRATPSKFWNRWSVDPRQILKSLSRKSQRLIVAAWSCNRPKEVERLVIDRLLGRRKIGRLSATSKVWKLLEPHADPCRHTNWYVAVHLDELSFNKAGWDALIDEVITGAPVDATLQSDDAYTLLMDW